MYNVVCVFSWQCLEIYVVYSLGFPHVLRVFMVDWNPQELIYFLGMGLETMVSQPPC